MARASRYCMSLGHCVLWSNLQSPIGDWRAENLAEVPETQTECLPMNTVLIVLLLVLLLGGGGGFYYGGPYVGGGIGGLLLVVLIVWLLMGRRA